MRWVWNKNVVAGVILGAIAAATTISVQGLTLVASNLLLRVLETVAFAFTVPGLLVAFAAAHDVHHVGLGFAALCNFTFWFCFGWLCSYLLRTLREQIHLLASQF